MASSGSRAELWGGSRPQQRPPTGSAAVLGGNGGGMNFAQRDVRGRALTQRGGQLMRMDLAHFPRKQAKSPEKAEGEGFEPPRRLNAA
jgi:hypothetical protein